MPQEEVGEAFDYPYRLHDKTWAKKPDLGLLFTPSKKMHGNKDF